MPLDISRRTGRKLDASGFLFLIFAMGGAALPVPHGAKAQNLEAEVKAEREAEFRGLPLPRAKRAAYIRFDTSIGPFSEHRFYRKLDEAESAGADVVVVEIESPGGLVDSSVNLANRLNELEWATTIAYVPREAISGAAIMSLGCDFIIMHEYGKIGDAGPIVLGTDSMFRHAPEKTVSYLVEIMRDLAETHDRPPTLAASMVDKDLPVYEAIHEATGEVRYVSDAEWEKLKVKEGWKKGAIVRESSRGRFLEMNGRSAVQHRLANGVVRSRGELAERLGISEEDFVVLESNWVDNTAMILNSWPITVLLVIVGIIALYVELLSPGIGVGALVAGLCAALFFWSRFLGGTSGWLEVVLFLAGLVFLAVEFFVIPGFGVAGLTGGGLLLLSFIMASQRFDPNDGIQMADLQRSLLILTGSGVAAVAGMVFLSQYLGKIPILHRLALEAPSIDGSKSPTKSGFTIVDELPIAIGDEGVADSALRPSGRARIGEAFVDVVADGSYVEAGQTIRVIKVSGTRIMVREVS